MNPLNPPIYGFFYHLNTLNGLLFTLDNQLKMFEKLYRDAISKSVWDIDKIFSGAKLTITDITELPEDGWARPYPTGKFYSKGEEYFKLIKVLLARESAWTISQAYEAYEKYLKDIFSILLLKNPQLASTIKVDKFESDKKSHNIEKTDISFWRSYIDYHYKTNKDKLKFLRQISPDITKAETQNNRGINLTAWFAVVEELRHSATHSNFLIKTGRIKNWSKVKREILKKYFFGKNTEKGYQLDITKKDATFSLELFSEYSFQVYKCLSISREYDWNILHW